MQPNRMPLLAAFAALLALAGATGWYCWSNRTQEFHGTLLKRREDVICLPGHSVPLAYLITSSGSYDLRFPSARWQPVDRRWIDEISRMDGKEVIVRGKLEVWRDKYQGNRQRRRICVDDMQLSPQSAATAPGNG